MVKAHKPAMFVLFETKMTEHKNIIEVLRFDAQIQSPSQEIFGGTIIMWKEEALKLENLTVTMQGIHVTVKVIPNVQY